MPLPYNASARCFDKLNMTENFYESAVNRLIRPFFVFYALQPFTLCHSARFIFCHSERSRGISWQRSFLLPRGRVFFCHSERSRGISWKRTRRLILNTFSFNAKKRLRATRTAVLLTYKQHYKAETRRM